MAVSNLRFTRIPPEESTAISRRDALKGAAGLATIAVSSVTLGQLTGARAQAPAPTNPYVAQTNTGPSSSTVPAIGAMPSVPGTPYIVPPRYQT